MSRSHSYLKTAVQIIDQYKGEEPFASFIRKYFSQHKKHGSKDRKQISHLCYCFFRLGKAWLNISVEERILIGLFLCSNDSNEILQELKPQWNDEVAADVNKKLLIINYSLFIVEVFPWQNELSEGIDHKKFCGSFFIQPDLFLRLRPGYENLVKGKLSNANVDFREINYSCLSLANNTKVETMIDLDKEAVVQDYSSQQTLESLKLSMVNGQLSIEVWDCCAASGGKSLLLYDIDSNIDLTVSDIRESILVNLKKRFDKAGIKRYRSFVTDLTKPVSQFTAKAFDLILCDAPCTGSGTWSRTPEQLYFFEKERIEKYAILQKKIVSNIIPYLKENGFLIYITCSVFRNENEDVINYIQEKFGLEVIRMDILKGYDKKADTMFVTLLKKKL